MREILNDLLADYFVPLLILLFAVTVAVGLLNNQDKLKSTDKETKQEGIVNMVYVIGGALVAITLLSIIFSRFKGVFESWSL